jgi:hypothetical protein
MKLAEKPKPRRNETRDLTKPILVALNKLCGCRFARCNTGYGRPLSNPDAVVHFGLGDGTTDIVGIVDMGAWRVTGPVWTERRIGRVCVLEVKWPGVKPKPDQVKWMAEVRKLGGFAAVVHSVDEGIAAVARCREGLDR